MLRSPFSISIPCWHVPSSAFGTRSHAVSEFLVAYESLEKPLDDIGWFPVSQSIQVVGNLPKPQVVPIRPLRTLYDPLWCFGDILQNSRGRVGPDISTRGLGDNQMDTQLSPEWPWWHTVLRPELSSEKHLQQGGRESPAQSTTRRILESGRRGLLPHTRLGLERVGQSYS